MAKQMEGEQREKMTTSNGQVRTEADRTAQQQVAPISAAGADEDRCREQVIWVSCWPSLQARAADHAPHKSKPTA